MPKHPGKKITAKQIIRGKPSGEASAAGFPPERDIRGTPITRTFAKGKSNLPSKLAPRPKGRLAKIRKR